MNTTDTLVRNKMPWQFLLITWLALAVVTTSVPVVDYLRRPAGSVFTGYSYESVGDIFGYLNMIEQAERGHVLFTPIMSAVQNAPGFFNPFFLLIGWGGALFHLSPLAAWHAARIVLILLLIILLWKALSNLLEKEMPRRVVLVGMLLISGVSPTQNHESSTFVSLLYSPLTLAMLCCMLGLTLACFAVARNGLRWRSAAVIAGTILAQSYLQPYVLPVMVILPIVWVALLYLQQRIPRQTLFRTVMLVGLASAATFYLLYFMASHNPVIREYAVSFRNVLWQVDIIFLYMTFLLPATCAFVFYRRRKMLTHPASLWMVLWLVITLFFLFVPYPYSGRLISLVHVPLEFFSVAGLAILWRGRWKYFHCRPLAAIIIGSLLYPAALHLVVNWTGNYEDATSMKYIDATTQKGFIWIRKNTPHNAILFTAPSWDTLFSQQVNRQAYAISGGFQRDFWHRAQQSFDLLAGHESPERLFDFLSQNHIGFIVVSQKERDIEEWVSDVFGDTAALQYAFQFVPERYTFLYPVYDVEGFRVYQVKFAP